MEIYRGIPFAAPPVGSLRFMPPVTRTPWREIRSATRFGPVCPQLLPETRNETAALLKMSQGRLKAIRDMKPMLTNQTEGLRTVSLLPNFEVTMVQDEWFLMTIVYIT